MGRILFISSSMRNGNCKKILEEIQQTFWLEHSTEIIFLRDYDITPCTGCHACRHTSDNKCVKGDKVDLVIEKIIDADVVVFASPNYFYNISGLAKNFIDKTLPYYELKTLTAKKFIFVYTGEDEPSATKKYLDRAIEGFVDCHGLRILGSFAYQTPELNVFGSEEEKRNNNESICKLIRQHI